MVYTYVVGPLRTNTYVIYDEKSLEAIIVDPGGDEVLDYVGDMLKELNLKYVIATHGHLDHVLGIRSLRRASRVGLLLHKADESLLSVGLEWAGLWGIGVTLGEIRPDGHVYEGFTITLGETQVRVLHTPGHTPGSVTLYVPSLRLAFTGDTLFRGSVGRTDLPGGSSVELMASLRRLLIELDRASKLLPGHGPSTTLEEELLSNRYLRSLNVMPRP